MALADVSARVNIDELERGILEYWDKKKIFEESLARGRNKKLFTFYDGPPYATGKPHYGHILQSAIKDTVLRYKTMRGYFVPRRVGWDCHGLPVETIVEKELGFNTKKDIEKFGIENFNKKCRETVFRYIDDFTRTLKRMGRWADYDQAYTTLDKDYMESEWGVFKQLWDKGLVYKAFRSTPYCVRCETPLSNFEVAGSYKDRVDTAVYVLLKLKTPCLPAGRPTCPAGRQNSKGRIYLLIWTTTPWTLPGNAAVAVNAKLTYVGVEREGKEIIVAKERVNEVCGDGFKIVREWKVEELKELQYESLYAGALEWLSSVGESEASDRLFKIVESEHVSADEGTGLVHIAPAFGEEDSEIGRREDWPVLRTVDPSGRLTDQVKEWQGISIWEANEKIIKDLDERGLLLKKEKYKHSYPFCWRCDEPLIYYALDTWFVAIHKLKDEMLAVAEQISWTPRHVKQGRFRKGIESAPDWAVSRNRFWSVPMPVWECERCAKQACVGSLRELEDLSGVKGIEDMHRPYVDEITWGCSDCQGVMRRVPEVLDVWFDSGSMPYAVKQGFPADFIVESIEQTRLWFYVLHVLAVALKGQPAFRNAVGSGLIFAEDGRKLSKKLKNYPEPEPTIAKYGADTLRLYLLASTSLGEPYRFSEKELGQLQRNVYLTLWNVYSFFVRYANTHEWPAGQKKESQNILDRWIMARLKQLETEVFKAMEDYRVDRAARAFIPFIDDLSNWYVRRSRQRFQRPGSGKERDEAFGTLWIVLVRLAKLVAPFMPYMSEEIYRNLARGDSVHLEQLDEPIGFSEGEREVLDEMGRVRAVVVGGLALRAGRRIKVRQPLQKLEYVLVEGEQPLGKDEVEIVKDEVNVRDVEQVDKISDGMEGYVWREGEMAMVGLDTEITPELKREGVAREIIRHGQALRREANYKLNERITLIWRTDAAKLREAFGEQQEMITRVLQVDKVVEHSETEEAGSDIILDGQPAHLGVVKG